MLTIKNLSPTDIQTLQSASKTADPASAMYDRHSVKPVPPQVHFSQLKEALADVERRMNLSGAHSIGGQSNLSTRPLVWLAGKLSGADYTVISRPSARSLMMRYKLNEILNELDATDFSLDQKIKMIEMVQISDRGLDNEGRGELQKLLQNKIQLLKSQQGSDSGATGHAMTLAQLRARMVQLRKSEGLGSTPVSAEPVQTEPMPSAPVAPSKTPPVTESLDRVCHLLATHLSLSPEQIQHRFRDYCHSLLEGTADDNLVKEGVYQGKSRWPSAEELKAFTQNEDSDFPLKPPFLALVAKYFKVDIDCEIKSGNEVHIKRFGADGKVRPSSKRAALFFSFNRAELADNYSSIRNDEFDQAPKSLFSPVLEPLKTKNQNQSTEDILLASKAIQKGEYQGIVEAWGEHCPKLNSPDFPEQYRRLKFLLIESNSVGQRFSFEDMARIHKSGLLEYCQQRIDQACRGNEDMRQVYRDLESDYGRYVHCIDGTFHSSGTNFTAKLAGPAMTNWAQNCWMNAANQMLVDVIDESIAKKIREKKCEGEFSQQHQAVRDAVLALWQACDDIRTGKEHPHSVAGYQMMLMKALYNLGQVDFAYTSISNIFRSEKPMRQEDPQEYLNELCALLGMHEMPECCIRQQNQVTAVINNKEAVRLAAQADPYCMTTLAREEKPSAFKLIDQSFKHAYSQMPPAYRLHEHQWVAEALRNFHTAVDNYVEENGEIEIKTAQAQLSKAIKGLAERCVAPDQPIVQRSVDRFNNPILILNHDCNFSGYRLNRGAVFSYMPTRENPVVELSDLGPDHRNVLLCLGSDGDISIKYNDRFGNQYIQGVAVTDQDGRLALPLIHGRHNSHDFDDKNCFKFSANEEIYTHDGCTVAYRYSNGVRQPGDLVIRKELIDLVKRTDLESLEPGDTRMLCNELAAMMGISNCIDRSELDKTFAPASLMGSLNTLLKGLKTNNAWSKKELDAAGLNITDWYPVYLEQQQLNLEDVLAEAKSNGCVTDRECFQWHYDNKVVKAKQNVPKENQVEVKIEGMTGYTLIADTAVNRKFIVHLKMFEHDGYRATKEAKYAQEVFASIGGRATLPVTDKSGNKTQVSGKVSHLVCHRGAGISSGHYISLKFTPDQKIYVEDDTVVLELNDYLKLYGYPESTTARSIPEILSALSLEPYVILFERDEQ